MSKERYLTGSSDRLLVNRRFAVAPMLDYTDRHARFLYRLLSNRALLYTEMMATGALLYGDARMWLEAQASAHPVAAQLGGNEPGELAQCARWLAAAGFDEVNLNLGCPSERVQRGQFGAGLMRQPERVAECIRAISGAVDIPVTVKCRIGVDEQDSYAQFADFIGHLHVAGCRVFIIHARKAWLQGISPKDNRRIPPLRYDYVYRLKREFPTATIVLNGGLKDLAAASEPLQRVDGVMLGRAVYDNPWLLSQVDQQLYLQQPVSLDRFQVGHRYAAYCRHQLTLGASVRALIRPLFGLFYGQPGARLWRRLLHESVLQSDLSGIDHALQQLLVLQGRWEAVR